MRVLAGLLAVVFTAAPAMAQQSAPAERFCHTGPKGCFQGYNAYFTGPTGRYGHNVLGDTPEWTELVVTAPDDGVSYTVSLPETVYEDIAPRLADIDGDGVPEVIAVESHPQKGARLTIRFGVRKLVATPYIGTRFRWLAPAGIADYNQDGAMDLAYVDRPHLAKTLRLWSYDGENIRQIQQVTGVSNHRIGEAFITGETRFCAGKRPELLVLSADYTRIIGLRLGPNPETADHGPYEGRVALRKFAEQC